MHDLAHQRVSGIRSFGKDFNDNVPVSDDAEGCQSVVATIVIFDDDEITGVMTAHEMCGLEHRRPWAAARNIQHAKRVEEHVHSP